MKTYVVGGAVRDQLLGLPVRDRDHVVVGGTPEDMERLGFRPVGKDFPVFLHPVTQEEYALARTERKTARGYKGFSVHAAPEVTLEEDLARRDLSINAMAREEREDGGAGELVDPFGGERDLGAGLLRHVSPAFVEDPVRILRVARFAARFDFAVAGETMDLMRRMVGEGEADALVPERVWQEFSKGLMERHAPRMFEVLAACGLAGGLFAECDLAFRGDIPASEAARAFMAALAYAAEHDHVMEARFALLAFALRPGAGEAGLAALCARLRATSDCRDAALLALRHGAGVMTAPGAPAPARLALLEASDAFRRPARLDVLLAACECAQFGAQTGTQTRVPQPWPPRTVLLHDLATLRRVDAAAVSSAAKNAGMDIAIALRRARTEALQASSI